MLLPSDAAPGTPLQDVIGPPETVFDLEVTWNRPDCLNIIGVAREVAALVETKLNRPSTAFTESGPPVESLARVDVEDHEGCPRYTARMLTGVRIGASPAWMQRRLLLCGVRAISNVVDITNYVMLECGQPLHAFDHELLREGRIVVRRARRGETLHTLDGVARALTPDMLVIADAEDAVAVAGIMGGAGSEIRDITRTVLLESACFDPRPTRHTSTALGLNTESSARFERGVDVLGVDWASRRAAALMVELAGATAAKGVVDVFARKPASRRINCRFRRLRELLGVEVPGEKAVEILNSLELPVVSSDESGCTIEAPTFRRDLEIEADVIEEVARVHGLDEVPQAEPKSRVVPDARDDSTRALLKCRARLIGLGLSEIVNCSFVSGRMLDLFSAEDAAIRVVLPDPVSMEHAVLRNSLLPQMVECLGKNLAHHVLQAALFEIGRVFRRDEGGQVAEEDRVSVGLLGRGDDAHGYGKTTGAADEIFLRLKGVVERLCAAQHVPEPGFVPARHAAFEPDAALEVHSAGHTIGILGLVAERIRGEWRMRDPVALAELRGVALIAHLFDLPALRPLPSYPSVTRDVAIVVEESVPHDRIVKTIRGCAPNELTGLRLFDIFRSDDLGEGRKSLAYSLTYRSKERTLTDEEANAYHEIVKEALRKELGAEIREG